MLLPVQVESRRTRIPRVTVGLLLVYVTIYLATAVEAALANHRLLDDLRALPAPVLQQWGLWPEHPSLGAFLTAPWVHVDLLHLAGNLLFLWVFGAAAEEAMGSVAVLVICIAGGLAATLSQWLMVSVGLAPADAVYAGSSGAVIALIVAFSIRRYRAQVRLWLVALELSVPAWSVLLAFAVWYGLLPAMHGGETALSGYWGHLGAALAGLALSLILGLTSSSVVDYSLEDAVGRLNRGDLKQGLEELEHLRRLAEKDPRIPLTAARAHLRVWDRTAAALHYGRAVQAELASGRVEGAAAAWEEASAAEAWPSPAVALRLAGALARAGKVEPAHRLYEWTASHGDDACVRIARQRLDQLSGERS